MGKIFKNLKKLENFQKKKHCNKYRKIRIWGKDINHKKNWDKMKNKKIEKETKQKVKN